jgi:F-type H+-transporting ATPase subunit b
MQLFDERFWLAISFLIFLYLVYRPIKNAILRALDKKITIVKNQVLEAQKLNEDTTLLFNHAEQQIDKIESLREKMLKDAKELADVISKQQTKEINQFLENKKSEAIDLINRQKLKASEDLHSEFCDKMTELVAEYLRSIPNNSLSDSDIAKKFMQEV